MKLKERKKNRPSSKYILIDIQLQHQQSWDVHREQLIIVLSSISSRFDATSSYSILYESQFFHLFLKWWKPAKSWMNFSKEAIWWFLLKFCVRWRVEGLHHVKLLLWAISIRRVIIDLAWIEYRICKLNWKSLMIPYYHQANCIAGEKLNLLG